jgi:hypothetical protein
MEKGTTVTKLIRDLIVYGAKVNKKEEGNREDGNEMERGEKRMPMSFKMENLEKS